ncbi:hypothetical protein [Falsiroseomonas sp. HW251]|uniref:hypothetical protein n=1 Tax=Falsiroseomonas sp. HW251 TaxID=3390998 RepID=UPI003D321078
MKRTLEAVAGSTALAALSRVGVPLLLAMVIWAGGALIALDRRAAVLEQGREGAAADVMRRLSALESADQRDREIIGQMRADLASLLAQQAATLRALDRVERALERRERP